VRELWGEAWATTTGDFLILAPEGLNGILARSCRPHDEPAKQRSRLNGGARNLLMLQKYHNQPYFELDRSDFNKEVASPRDKPLA
jgi:hypothetical protein